MWIMRIHFGLHIQIRRVGREEVMKKVAMKVAMLVGMLMLNVVAGFYYDSADGRLSDGGDVHAREDFPPPTWP